jgi:predicted dinucleotide-utilizing enzyme
MSFPTKQFPVKHPEEEIVAGTDWTTRPLNTGETIVSASVEIVVQHGIDTQSDSMLSGSAGVNASPVTLPDGTVVAIGKLVSQRIIGGLPGVTYETRWKVITNQQELETRLDFRVE